MREGYFKCLRLFSHELKRDIIMNKLDFITEELSKLKDAGLLINIRTIEGPQGLGLRLMKRRS